MSARRIQEYLKTNEVDFEVQAHERTYTAQETAAVTHVKGKELAKSVILASNGDLFMAVVPSSRMVDVERMKALTGLEDLRLADESEFSNLFSGCELGAIPPLGKLFGVDMWVDDSLKADEEIAFPAGTHTEILKIDFADFENLERPKFARISSGKA